LPPPKIIDQIFHLGKYKVEKHLKQKYFSNWMRNIFIKLRGTCPPLAEVDFTLALPALPPAGDI